MKTQLGRMEAFDALLEARFEAFFSESEEPSEHLGDETAQDTVESVDERDSLPAMPPPAADRVPRSQTPRFV